MLKNTLKEVIVFYTFVDKLTLGDISAFIDDLSVTEREKIWLLKREKDKIESLVGRILLRHMMVTVGIHQIIDTSKISISKTGRPFFKGIDYDFNISHSNGAVACGLFKGGKIGVDIEAVQHINVEDYRLVLTNEEYFYLQQQSSMEFIKLWVTKESVLKADGRGFLADPQTLSIRDNYSIINNKKWFNHLLKIKQKYYLAIALSDKVLPTIKEICISNLIK
jgi:Phosphopantetheinyl transferase